MKSTAKKRIFEDDGIGLEIIHEDGSKDVIGKDKKMNIRISKKKEKPTMKITIHKGGPGSGFHGHAGRPGKQGGSLSGNGGSSVSGDDSWTKGKGNSWEKESGPVLATISEQTDGGSKYLAVSFSLTHKAKTELLDAQKKLGKGKYFDTERVLWGKDFGEFLDKYSDKRKWSDSDLKKAQDYVKSVLDDFQKDLLTPKKKPPKGKIQLPYYD